MFEAGTRDADVHRLCARRLELRLGEGNIGLRREPAGKTIARQLERALVGGDCGFEQLALAIEAAQARAAFDENVATYQEAVLGVFREVEDQLAALRILDEEAKIQRRAVDAAERSLQQATNRYRGGLASYLEVTFAQSVALANERTAVDLLTRRMTASVLLIKGLGGGWDVRSLPAVSR